MTALVELAVEDKIAIVTLNRPEVRNAINDAMRSELVAVLERVAADQSVRALVLTGAGKGFCSGGDIAGMKERLTAPSGQVGFNGWRRQGQVHKSVGLLHGMPKPVIAAVNGAAAGLGCDMALACDFILASEQAAFTMSFVKRGLVSDGGGMYFLPRRVGLPRAKDLIFTGRVVEANEALAIGLADRVTAPDRLIADAVAWACELTQGSSVSIAFSKTILDRTFESTEEQVFALGREAQAVCYTTDEHRDAVTAFLNKAGR
ncbi:MAG TPA: enoyl-CoA hydratase-related protein [Pseudolabrys sp.]|uniref:enoyl-CoA hydratase/isomerase family protein n=1 Tax=Pseudolabrys sp. TaxID=1960880 RepID=UPI002DDD786C|nr:enoyl-CoA hydratase-related protein [Pseudolabrys sp.]HEV2631113.1 enoyl-CoA hydratase-related protein [Pseudolabrys sp.]